MNNPFAAGGIYNLDEEIIQLRKVAHDMLASTSVVPHLTDNEFETLCELATPKLKAKLISIHQGTYKSYAVVAMWEKLLNSLGKLVKVGGGHALDVQDRITQREAERIVGSVINALTMHIKDARLLASISHDIKVATGQNVIAARIAEADPIDPKLLN